MGFPSFHPVTLRRHILRSFHSTWCCSDSRKRQTFFILTFYRAVNSQEDRQSLAMITGSQVRTRMGEEDNHETRRITRLEATSFMDVFSAEKMSTVAIKRWRSLKQRSPHRQENQKYRRHLNGTSHFVHSLALDTREHLIEQMLIDVTDSNVTLRETSNSPI